MLYSILNFLAISRVAEKVTNTRSVISNLSCSRTRQSTGNGPPMRFGAGRVVNTGHSVDSPTGFLLRFSASRGLTFYRRNDKVKAVPWDRPFTEPIEWPKGKGLITLRDAALYITKLPKAEHDAEEWQAAMQALMLVADCLRE
jgi:hypothetical protein